MSTHTVTLLARSMTLDVFVACYLKQTRIWPTRFRTIYVMLFIELALKYLRFKDNTRGGILGRRIQEDSRHYPWLREYYLLFRRRRT